MFENGWNPYLLVVVHCLLLVSSLQATLACRVEATTKKKKALVHAQENVILKLKTTA